MKLAFIILGLLVCTGVYGQKEIVLEKGQVSYVSSQNVYIKFASTEHIQKGDTLYYQKDSLMVPAMVVKDKSSTSCVCSSLLKEKAKLADPFYARSLVDKKPEKSNAKKTNTAPTSAQDSISKAHPVVVLPADDKVDQPYKQLIRGRVSAASYSNFYDGEATHRMRYTFSFQGNNLHKSKFSVDNYITFRHTIGEWSAVKDNFNDALKVYSLAIKYDLDKKTSISLGRKINLHISSMGAIDGLQAERTFGHFLAGAIVGSRPDYADYRLNLNLFQAGAFVGYSSNKNNNYKETTLAIVEQHNHTHVDRRFTYFQHSNNISKDLNFFGSFEVDMYQYVDSVVSTKPSLTNMLLSLRYRVSKSFSISASYDNRKNIIYYESYKSYIDQLIENETRQGMRLGANWRISKQFTAGANASLRFQKSNPNLSKNLNAYLNINKIPWLNATASLSANILQTEYLDSKIYGVRVSKELIRGKLNSEIYYRMVDYNYKSIENKIQQQIGGIDLSWYITRKLGLHLYYEGTFDKTSQPFNRLNTSIIKRF